MFLEESCLFGGEMAQLEVEEEYYTKEVPIPLLQVLLVFNPTYLVSFVQPLKRLILTFW